MKLERFIDLNGKTDVSGLFYASGSFGTVDHTARYERKERDGVTVFTHESALRLTAEFEPFDNGLVMRRDALENVSDKEITLYALFSRFRVTGGAFEAYTQFNGWQHESEGGWQSLFTEASVSGRGIRTCDGAAPLLALCDGLTGKSAVFHLFPNCKWKMTARKTPVSGRFEAVVVETGLEDRGLHFTVAPGERIELPPVAFFTAHCKTDLDAYKLHEVYNRLLPRRSMPVMYNSWLYDFGNIDADGIFRQIDAAAQLGIEAFMIDAGWYGNGGGWSEQTGDWTENPKVRLKEISDRAHEKGLKFGLWFEPERGGRESRAVKERPEYFINGRFLDFSIPAAREYMLKKVCSAIEKFRVDWVKFDFNDTLADDACGCAFYRYYQGQREFVRALKERFPGIYITCCAGGGYRMELAQGALADSFWLSDDQGAYNGIRIVKDTLKRMPPQLIERWTVHTYCGGFPVYGKPGKSGLMLSVDNATGDRVRSLGDGFYTQFMTGGPVGFSCDIAAFPEDYKKLWKEHIAKFKKDRGFWLSASARVLADGGGLTVLSYSDSDLDRVVIQAFAKDIRTREAVVYPAVDPRALYRLGDKTLSGKEIAEDGVLIEGLTPGDCAAVELIKER